MDYPDFSDPFYPLHAQRLDYSYRYWIGEALYNPDRGSDPIKALFNAPFVLVSHGTEAVPIFNFGNRNALALFELDWNHFIKLPSKNSADQDNQADRAQLMARVQAYGFATDCRGIRITATGKQFLIEGAIVWNVIDEQGDYHGQAAMFSRWSFLTI